MIDPMPATMLTDTLPATMPHGIATCQTARIRSSRLVRAVAAVALSAGVLGLLAGCERSAESNSEVVDKGTGLVQAGASDEAAKALQSAVSKGGETGATVQANAALGVALLDQARANAARLSALYDDVRTLQLEIGQVATAVSVGNTLVAGYRAEDPAPARNLIRQRVGEAQGGPDKTVWVDTGKQPLPSIASARQNVSDLQQKVAAKQDEIRRYEADRAAAVQEADKLRDQADSLKGRESVDAFARASEARKSVSVVSGRIDAAQNELTLLQRQLEVAQGQLDVVSKYVDVLERQNQSIDNGQKGILDTVGGQLSVSKTAITAPAPPAPAPVAPAATSSEAGGENAPSASVSLVSAPSLAAKAEVLAAKMEEAHALYEKAAEQFKAAGKAFESAFGEAGKLRSTVAARLANYQDKPADHANRKALESLQRNIAPAAYRLDQAAALQQLGDLDARRAEILAAQASLVAEVGSAVKAAGESVPAKLTAPDAAAVKAARDAASESYERAIAELEGVESSIQGQDPERRRQTSNVMRVYVLASWAANLEAGGDAAKAKEKLDAARTLRDSVLQENNGTFPGSLPGLLATSFAPPAAPPAESPAPSEPPAAPAAPATPAAPAPEAAPATPAAPPAPAAPSETPTPPADSTPAPANDNK